MRKELRFILRSVEFSICDTFRKIFKSSFSFSSDDRSADADACNLPNRVYFRHSCLISFFANTKSIRCISRLGNSYAKVLVK